MTFFTYFLPILTILLLLVFFLNLPNLNTCHLPGETPPLSPGRPGKRRPRPDGEDRSRALSRRDALPILAVTLLYALTAFFRLGSSTDPQTFVPMEGQEAEFALPDGASPSVILLYPGVGMGKYELWGSEDGESYQRLELSIREGQEYKQLDAFNQDHIAVLKWTEVYPSGSIQPRYLRLRCSYSDPNGPPWLGEVLVLDGDGQTVPLSCSIPALIDEQDTRPARFSFQNSSYFDEIYHARTAWEHLNSVRPYEVTHPPLGKEIIGLGIRLFGMTPFGWRFSGTLFGVLMLPILYVFLKKLFGGRWIPTLGTVLFASDFMHYVQTRIATIDTYSVFFILLMYLFMYLWLTEDKLWALALCGVSFGLGAAAKWTSIYAGAGLAILWAAKWIHRFLQARKRPVAPTSGRRRPNRSLPAEQGSALREDEGQASPLLPFVKNALFCVIFFIVVPAAIYYFSYLPYGAARGIGPFSRDYLQMVLDNQVYMFTYHSKSVLGSTHPFSSVWYQWLIDYRPILYVREAPVAGMHISIAAWLNPVLCWGGLLSLPVLGWTAIGRRDRRAAFILVGYLSELLPWVPVARLTFAYHYFPSALFLVLGIAYVLALLRENRKSWRTAALSFVGGSVLLFVLFFPVLNGIPVRDDLITALLQWFPSWPL